MQNFWMSKRNFSALTAALLLSLGSLSGPANAADDPQSKTVSGLTIYYGIVPAAIVKGHPTAPVERTMRDGLPQGQHAETIVKQPMHGAPPPKSPAPHVNVTMGSDSADGSQYHLVVAIFDAVTGARVSNATVQAEIFPLNVSGTMLKLEPMQIARTTTYGGFFRAPDAHHYTIRLTVRIPSKRNAVTLTFQYAR